MMKLRGTRKIDKVTHVGPQAFVWHMACGHTLSVTQAPRLGQRSAVCSACRGGAAYPQRSKARWKAPQQTSESKENER